MKHGQSDITSMRTGGIRLLLTGLLLLAWIGVPVSAIGASTAQTQPAAESQSLNRVMSTYSSIRSGVANLSRWVIEQVPFLSIESAKEAQESGAQPADAQGQALTESVQSTLPENPD